MKVKIIKCKYDTWWYNDKIGEIFEVEKNISTNTYEYHTLNWTGGIDIEDCIDIVELREQKLNRIVDDSQNN